MKNISHNKRTTLGTQAAIFKALASTIRLAIVTVLYERDRPVNEIVAILRRMGIPKTLDRTNVCKNLARLRKLSIVSCRKERQLRVYSLRARCLLDAMRCTLDLIALEKKPRTLPVTAGNAGGGGEQ